MSVLDRFRGRVAIADVKLDLLRTAYDNDGAFLNRFDPRVVLVWYLCFVVVPWLFYDPRILVGLLLFVSVIAVVSRVSAFLVAVLAFGVVTNLFFIALVAAVLSDPLAAVQALVPYTMKLTIVSVASLAVFSSMSPDNVAKGLLSLGVPRQLTFAIAYGYRMLPVLIEEYHALVNSFRLRSKAPERPGYFRWRYYAYLLGLTMKAFYPMILNVAKRSRVTVEALETRGFSDAMGDEQARAVRLDDLRVGGPDVAFVAGSLAVVAVVATAL